MTTVDKKLDQRLEHLKAVCRQAGLKVTQQRLEIFRELAASEDHPNAEQVFKKIRKRLPTVSLDTVYRTLWMLVDLGLIKTMGPGRGRTRFDANLDQHHHFVCTQCGLTRDFYNQAFDNLSASDSVEALGTPQDTHVEVRGICHQCIIKNEK